MKNCNKSKSTNKKLNITDLVEKYVVHCLNSEIDQNTENESSSKRKANKSRFPNFAGFCRYYGFTKGYINNLKLKKPTQYESLCMVFEDEALNSELSPTVLNAYLKRHLGYEKKSTAERNNCDNEQIQLVFEHDIENAGK